MPNERRRSGKGNTRAFEQTKAKRGTSKGWGRREKERERERRERMGREWKKRRVRKNECFVFAHIPRNILCLSLLPLVYPVSVRPSFYFRFSFFLEPGSLHGAGRRSLVVARPSPPPSPGTTVHLFVRLPFPLAPPSIYSNRCLRSR